MTGKDCTANEQLEVQSFLGEKKAVSIILKIMLYILKKYRNHIK